MNAAIIIAALQLATKIIEAYPAIRAALETKDAQALDAAYEAHRRASNDVADRLRATPDDPVSA